MDTVKTKLGESSLYNIVEVRNAKEGDKVSVLEFCKDTFSWGDYIADVWDSWLSMSRLYVIEDHGTVVGVYNLSLFEKQAWIEGMRVHPQYRRKGLGKYMLTHAESIIKNKIIRLIIESENHPSVKLAESMGYRLEEKWRLYSMIPEKQIPDVKIVNHVSQIKDLVDTVTYTDSWKWLPLDAEEIQKLLAEKRIVISVDDESPAVGIWGTSRDFPSVFQIGYINGRNDGVVKILRYAQNKAYEMNCERIQIFAHEGVPLQTNFLEKRSLFNLMRKDIQEKSITFEKKVK